ncbi:MAG: pyruvate ferredoxin oxidoreductase [Nitrospinae bacterium RIFCSPLOWO2_12_FULL_45_22]|nr:MAG: pyruvate ferredoxin oxidoreductase [Nitrospinae bacterium RIFCSPLOWO2_12_FULL_45_22]
MEQSRTEIKITGFGGQGVILAAYIIGKAAALFDKKEATLTQSFGPEARGGACSAQMVISNSKVLYPYVKRPQILVCLSQEAYNKFEPELISGGLLIIEKDLVKPKPAENGIQLLAIPATRIAEELGRRMVLNIVTVGFFTAVADVVGEEAVRGAIKDSVPKGTEDLNLKAFERGFQYGKNLREHGE